MRNLKQLEKELYNVNSELKDLLKQSNKYFINQVIGDIEVSKRINKLNVRKYNLLININQLNQN